MPRHRAAGGFSLAELLAVMAILVLLMGIAVRGIRPPVSRSGMAGAQLVRALDLARSNAVARNRMVWVHLTADAPTPDDLAVRFHHTRDGSRDRNSVVESRRPLRFDDVSVADVSADLVERPKPSGLVTVAAGDWLVFKPDGQVFAGASEDDYPAAAETLAPVLEIGLRSTNRGTVTKSTERDAVVVHLHGATGASQVFEP